VDGFGNKDLCFNMQQENYFDDWGSPYLVIKVENPLLDAFKCLEATVTMHGASWEEVSCLINSSSVYFGVHSINVPENISVVI